RALAIAIMVVSSVAPAHAAGSVQTPAKLPAAAVPAPKPAAAAPQTPASAAPSAPAGSPPAPQMPGATPGTPAQPAKPVEAYTYEADNRRDPFITLLGTGVESAVV